MTRPQSLLYIPEPTSPALSRSPSPTTRKMRFTIKSRRSHESSDVSSCATSRSSKEFNPSARPSSAPWADRPFALISKPHAEKETAALFCATEMSIIHNIIIRSLNSIIQQGPYIPDATKPDYNPQDVRDLLFYTKTWCRNLDHHHHIEKTTFFPLVEQATGIVGLMDDLEVEHEEFHPGVIALQQYVEHVYERPQIYRWATMRTTIRAFAPALINHLHAEIDFLLNMDKFEGADLRQCWMESSKVAEKVDNTSDFFDFLPFVLGNADKTHDGGNNFPLVAKPVRHAMQHWFAKRHRGAWRFNTCDYYGRPQPLQMISEDAE